MGSLIKKQEIPPLVGLREFYEKRNTVLFVREVGGLGDILMHRMMFEDFKKVLPPECKIVWAVPPDYLDISKNHPFIDEVVNCQKTNIHDYLISYNTTTACGRHEAKVAPLADKHRSDIWANHCGIILKNHNMHLKIEPEMKKWAINTLKHIKGNSKCVIFSPISAQIGKNLNKEQIGYVENYLTKKGLSVIGLHNKQIKELKTTITNINHKQWLALIDVADYIISVDTSTFHAAGGLGKPLMGIFTYICGKTYGKYYDFILVQKHRDSHPEWNCGPCFNWSVCPKSKTAIKPCSTEINEQMLIEGIDKMLEKWKI